MKHHILCLGDSNTHGYCADGGIGGTYSAMSELFVMLDALVNSGNLATAREL